MSSLLVRKGLSLFKDDLEDEGGVKKKKNLKNPMKAISSRKKGVKKELRKLKMKQEMERQLKVASNSRRLQKTAIDDVRKKQGEDQTLNNLAYIQRLSQIGSTNPQTVNSILQHEKRLARSKHIPEPEKKKREQSILFSDDAFDMDKTKEEEEDEEFWKGH